MDHRRLRPSVVRRRGGTALLWVIVVTLPLTVFISLCVDWGHVQSVKLQMQISADDVALGVLNTYLRSGWTAATMAAASCPADNQVDPGSGIRPTTVVIGGSWNYATRTFLANDYTYAPAVKVVVSRTRANNNAVPIVWGSLVGVRPFDVTVTAVAAQAGGETGPVNVASTANLYLSGMPSGTTTVWGDSAANAASYQATSIPVTPGEWLTFTNLSGTTTILPSYVPATDAAGNASLPLHHGQNYNSNPNNPGPENGIADAVIPANAMTGLFLTDDRPDLSAPPATVDWTDSTQANQPVYSNLQPRAPFLIGNGQTAGGAVKRFQVPKGATRLFLGVWDGVQQSNNAGSISGTATVRPFAKLVQ